MMDKLKSVLLAVLVIVSLVQSYFLAYSMPSMEAKVTTHQDYVQTDPLGPEADVKDLLFPEQIVLHLGGDKHTVFFPDNTPFYDLILKKLQGREFRGLQRDTVQVVNWDEVRRQDQGLELRFGRAIPFQLLQRVFKIDDNVLFSRDSIDRIWIFARKDSGEVRTFFFSSDGRNVYESQRADLTVGDVATNVGFGQYWTPYQTLDGQLYIPDKSYEWVTEQQAPITRYTTVQMQRSLFIDPGLTRSIQERKDGSRIYTDGRRGLQIEQASGWMSYTDPVAPTETQNDLVDNVVAAVQFVNQHGGWNGQYRMALPPEPDPDNNVIRFQQYYDRVPIFSGDKLTLGYMQLRLQQGTVTSYERSLMLLDDKSSNKKSRILPGGNKLRSLVYKAAGGSKVEALYPAYRPTLGKEGITLHPVWVIRLQNGTIKPVAESVPAPTPLTPP
jgi:regulatory protein YycH of two-component signal transduction system YycFG